MKRTISVLLAAVLALSLTLPAAAATADQRLSQVTLAVKETLDIPDTYTEFSGDMEETELGTIWYLRWESADRSLRISADEEGKVLQYTLAVDSADSGPAAFPAVSRTKAAEIAQTFLDRVLTGEESAAVEPDDGTQTAGSDQYRFRTELLLYGLPGPIGISLTVDGQTGEVLRYTRDDLYDQHVGTVKDPAAVFADDAARTAAQEKAAALLKDTLQLRLEYVLDDSGERAVLRYLPESVHNYYVDAATGELVDLTARLRDAATAGDGGDSGGAEDSATESGNLSPAEQEGIAQMEGVWSKEQLDQAARKWTQLGLSGCSLAACTYWLDKDTGEVTATLRYNDQEGWRRTVTLDGKSGVLQSVSGPAWGDEDLKGRVSLETAQATAEHFLQALRPEEWKACGLYESAEAADGTRVHTFVFAQKENDYFFPANSYSVAVDVVDGSIVGFYGGFEENPVFDSAEGLIAPEAALDAWFDTYTVPLGYVNVIQDLKDYGSQYQQLLDLGYTYLYSLELGFYLEREDTPSGIDAKTGQPVYPVQKDRTIAYNDLEGCWGRAQAEALADYGVGWLGGSLQPQKQLTQLELMALLVSLDGYLPDLREEGAADQVYDMAVGMGLLTRAERDDDALMTRGVVVKALLDYGGYGAAAQIPGIFRCTYADEASIPAELYGYAAIAQGLGVVKGDGSGTFAAGRTATRLEAVVMVYQFMDR